MNKTELVVLLSNRTGSTQADANQFLNSFVEIVVETLGERNEKVVISGLGTFEIRNRVERKGKNPRTGEEIVVPAQKSPAFKAGKALKDAVKTN